MEAFVEEILRIQTQKEKENSPQPQEEDLDTSTMFLYHVWIDNYKVNPVVAELLKNGAAKSRIMVMLYAIERQKLIEQRDAMEKEKMAALAELHRVKAVCAEREEALKRLSGVDVIIKENDMYRTSVMEIGKKNIELEQRLQNQFAFLSSKFREEADARRRRGHETINRSHFELMSGVQELLNATPPLDGERMKDLWIKHMEIVRLVLETAF